MRWVATDAAGSQDRSALVDAYSPEFLVQRHRREAEILWMDAGYFDHLATRTKVKPFGDRRRSLWAPREGGASSGYSTRAAWGSSPSTAKSMTKVPRLGSFCLGLSHIRTPVT
jgi:hypothetical protein